jgi:hypothetical protein
MSDKGTEIQKITVKEFREEGYLQELNRCFLHPLGLAMEVEIADDGTETIKAVWDYRDDPEGMIFSPGVIDAEKAARISLEFDTKLAAREGILGYDIQPVEEN